MKLILTTINQAKVAILETASDADTKRGERYISEACLERNLETGSFIDITDRNWNPEGRIYLLKEDDK